MIPNSMYTPADYPANDPPEISTTTATATATPRIMSMSTSLDILPLCPFNIPFNTDTFPVLLLYLHLFDFIPRLCQFSNNHILHSMESEFIL
jgi:hypothetical protein